MALLGLVVLGGLAWVAFAVARWIFVGIIGLDAKIAAAIIAGCVTVLVSVGTVVYTQRKLSAREIANAHRTE